MMVDALLFCLGACAGSFLNVCIRRLPKGETVVSGRSRCPRCRHAIAWYDNIPLASFVLLAGRCRHCGRRISLRYPLVEFLGGALLPALGRKWGVEGPWFAAAFAASAAFLVVAFIDWDTFLIPDALSLGLLAAGVPAAAVNPLLSGGAWQRVGTAVVGAGFGFGVCWATAVVGSIIFKKDAMGAGDVKLMAAMGAWAGPLGCVDALLVACFLGSAYSLAMMAAGRLRRRDPIPFGPFLSAGIIVEFFTWLPFFRTTMRLMDIVVRTGPR